MIEIPSKYIVIVPCDFVTTMWCHALNQGGSVFTVFRTSCAGGRLNNVGFKLILNMKSIAVEGDAEFNSHSNEIPPLNLPHTDHDNFEIFANAIQAYPDIAENRPPPIIEPPKSSTFD